MLEQCQFEARQLNQGYFLFLWRNNKTILLKRFFDGAKNDLCVVIDFEKDATWMVLLENAEAYSPGQPFTTINALPKPFFLPLKHAFCMVTGITEYFVMPVF